MWKFHPPRKKNSGLSVPHTGIQLTLSSRLKASGKLWLVTTVMGRLAIGRTLRNGEFAATTVHANPIDDITLLGPVSQSVLFISWVGRKGLWSAESRGGWHPEKKALTDCFFRHGSWRYL